MMCSTIRFTSNSATTNYPIDSTNPVGGNYCVKSSEVSPIPWNQIQKAMSDGSIMSIPESKLLYSTMRITSYNLTNNYIDLSYSTNPPEEEIVKSQAPKWAPNSLEPTSEGSVEWLDSEHSCFKNDVYTRYNLTTNFSNSFRLNKATWRRILLSHKLQSESNSLWPNSEGSFEWLCYLPALQEFLLHLLQPNMNVPDSQMMSVLDDADHKQQLNYELTDEAVLQIFLRLTNWPCEESPITCFPIQMAPDESLCYLLAHFEVNQSSCMCCNPIWAFLIPEWWCKLDYKFPMSYSKFIKVNSAPLTIEKVTWARFVGYRTRGNPIFLAPANTPPRQNHIRKFQALLSQRRSKFTPQLLPIENLWGWITPIPQTTAAAALTKLLQNPKSQTIAIPQYLLPVLDQNSPKTPHPWRQSWGFAPKQTKQTKDQNSTTTWITHHRMTLQQKFLCKLKKHHVDHEP